SAFAQLAVHVLDEQLGQQRPLARQHPIALDPQQHQRQHRGDHVEPAGGSVGHSVLGIERRIARQLDHPVPQRTQRLARVGAGTEQAVEQGQGGRASSFMSYSMPAPQPPLRTTARGPKARRRIEARARGWQSPGSRAGGRATRMAAWVRIGAVFGAAALLAGCNSIVNHKGYIVDELLVQSVQPGVDNRQSVERTLGRPSFISQFGQPTWYYVSSTTAQKPFTTPKIAGHTVLAVRFDEAGNVV